MTRIDKLIRYLIAEDPQYSEIQIPEDLQGKRDLFRALRNVREPKPVSEEFLRLQDEELQSQSQERGVVKLDDIVGVCRGCVKSHVLAHPLFHATMCCGL